MKKYFLIFVFVMSYHAIFAQGGPAVVAPALPTLEFQQSPLFMGAGQIGAAVPMIDPLGFYFNPAQLGYFSQENNLAVLIMPQKTQWNVGRGIMSNNNITFNSIGAAAGYNFKKYSSIPLSIGIGYLHNKFDFGNLPPGGLVVPSSSAAQATYNVYDAFDCISLGVGLDYYLNFNIGFSIKPYHSYLTPQVVSNGVITPSASGTAYDFGVLIIAPISRLFLNNVKYNIDNGAFIKPKLNLTLGYGYLNTGKEVVYINRAQPDPLPRTAKLGYTLDLGIDLFVKQIKLNAIDYSFTGEAEDLLVNMTPNGIEYRGIFGRIQPVKHLINLKGDFEVIVHKGHIFRLFETVYITSGRYTGAGFNNIKSSGYGFSSRGLFKLLSASIDNSIFNFISDHLAIEYYDGTNFKNFGNDTHFKGLALFLKDFEL